MWTRKGVGLQRKSLVLLSWMVAGVGPGLAVQAQLGVRQHVNRQLRQNDPAEARTEQPAPAGEPANIAEEDLKQLKAAKSAEELTDLGKVFALSRKQAAAEEAVRLILTKKPQLLEDSQRQSPKAWHEIWFATRARMREQRLGSSDAAGRVRLAVWLHDAGLTGQARTLLKTALAIDKNLPAAQELAAKWHIDGGGPVRFDLSLGLKEPLLLDSVQDEGQTVWPRKGYRFLIVPIAYDPAGARLMISKGDAKASADGGKACLVIGLALLEASVGAQPSRQLTGRGPAPDLRMQGGGDPIWERLQLDPPKPNQPQELSAGNLAPPLYRPAPGQRGPAPARGGGVITGNTNKPMSGHAAYVLEVPADFGTVDCTFKRGEAEVKLEAAFLEALGKPVEGLAPADRGAMIELMSAQSASKSAPVASAALRKLSAVRAAILRGQEAAPDAPMPPAVSQIEKALLAGLGSEHAQVRRDTFNLLAGETSPGLAALIASTSDAGVLGHLGAELTDYFAELREMIPVGAADRGANDPAVQPASPATGGHAALPALPGSRAVIGVVQGALNSTSSALREQTLDAILASPFQETVDALSSAGNDSVTALLGRVGRLDDPPLKAVLLRVLIRRQDKKLLPDILGAFADTPIVVTGNDDPILDVALAAHTPAVQQRLFQLLAKADLTAAAQSDRLRKLIETLSAADIRHDASIRAAMLELASAQLKGAGYQAPIKRGTSPSMPAGTIGFEALVASVAAGANTDAKTAADAAAALVGLGQIQVLHERLQRLQPTSEMDKRSQTLIQSLARDKSLAAREALPMFLGMQLSSQSPRTLVLALSALRGIQGSVAADERWRVNMAIKQVVEPRQLVTLSVNTDETIAREARLLLHELARVSPTDAAEFDSLPDEGARQERLGSIEQSLRDKAVGPFVCMVYLDVQPARTQTEPGKPLPKARLSVPLRSSMIRYERPAQGGVRVIADDKTQIGPPQSDQQPSIDAGIVRINAAPILRAALESAEAETEGLKGKIDPVALLSELACDIKHDRLGSWSGEVAVPESPEPASEEYPLRVTGAKIIFEPATK